MPSLDFMLSLRTLFKMSTSGEDNMVVNSFYNQLFESNHDLHAEDESMQVRDLIYCHSPMDEILLFESDNQSRKKDTNPMK